MMRGVPGRIQSIVNIHNPSIEIHRRIPESIPARWSSWSPAADTTRSTSAPRGRTSSASSITTASTPAILRNRLRKDGYNAQTDAVYDALQAIRLIRAHATELGVDPHKIGIVGFSAGAELAAPAAVQYEAFDKANGGPRRCAGRHELTAGLRRHGLSGSDAVRPRAEARYSRSMRRHRFWSARVRATRSTRSGPTSTSRAFLKAASRISRCTSTGTAFMPTA